MNINALTRFPFETAAYWRARMCVNIQLTGTTMHQGAIMCAAVPHNLQESAGILSQHKLNNFMNAPHVFLYANQVNNVCLELPMYVNNKVARSPYSSHITASEPNDFVDIVVLCDDALRTATGGTMDLSAVVEVLFSDVEFFVPINMASEWVSMQGFASSTTSFIDGVFSLGKRYTGDLLDALREGVRKFTGLHNPPILSLEHKQYVQNRTLFNEVDKPVVTERLDPYSDFTRIHNQTYFKTETDEMDIQYLLSQPQIVSDFVVKHTTAVGSLLSSRPISPIMNEAPSFSTIQSKLAYMATAWSGDMELIIRGSMTNFTNIKIGVYKDYSRQRQATTQKPTFESVQGLPHVELDFSGGGTSHVVDLEYRSDMNCIGITEDPCANALSHGIYYIFLLAPMVIQSTTPNTCNFDVFMRCKPNFQLYGLSTRMFQLYPQVELFSVTDTVGKGDTDDVEVVQAQSVNSGNTKDVSSAFNVVVDDRNITEPVNIDPTINQTSLRPLTHIRDIIRRYQPCASYYVDTTNETPNVEQRAVVYDVMDLIQGHHMLANMLSPTQALLRHYMGITGGWKFKIRIMGATNASVQFVPPAPMCHSNTANAIGSADTISVNTTVNTQLSKQYGYIPTYMNPTCKQEATNYHTLGNTTVNTLDTGDKVNSSVVILDVEIPNLNTCDYVGNFETLNGSTSTGYAMALGKLVISFVPQGFTLAPNSMYGSVHIEVFMAASDETRLGIMVNNPALEFPYYKHRVTNPGTFLEYIFGMYPISDSVGIERNPRTICPGAYYDLETL